MESKNKRPRRHVTEIEEGETAAPLPRKRRPEGGDVRDDDNEEGESSGGGGGRAQWAVTEAEVEEFYAILRRVREARRLGGKARRTEEEIWQPQFAWEDFQYHAGCNADGGKNKTTAAAASVVVAAAAEEENKIEKVFDLNVQPAAGIGDY